MGKNRQTSRRGFTLIEILVVVAVMGAVAAVTVPAVSQARDRGRATATVAEVAAYETAAASYLAETGAYPVPDVDDVGGSCFASEDGVPSLCCVADEECTYAGTTLQPLARGAFASTPRGPLGGALPRLPRLPATPVAAGSLQYRGVFHSCDTAACQRPTVAWTQPTACAAGTTRNGVTGLCERQIDRAPVVVVGQRETYCYNEADDDGDGSTDCADGDCAGRAKCGAETGATFCADVFDNDGDGSTDCADGGCAGAASCAGEHCANGVDDDGDGAEDCADPDCASSYPCLPPETGDLCGDAIDNDADNVTDCADGDCALYPGCGETPCSDAAACNFGEPGSCEYASCYCLDAEACNYNARAACDYSSCGTSCGDGVCDGGETVDSCWEDCGW